MTLYELATGRLPFDARDPMELVHQHIARRAVPPHEISGVPRCFSDVIMKLLEKTAEARYQTAPRLRADLEICLAAVLRGEEPAGFVAGQGDRPDRLQISQRLYGRDDDVARLLSAFEGVAEPEGRTELVLVAGYSGVGKSAIVNEVHKPITERRGFFIAGKFDQLARNVPYASMILAFQALVRQVLTGSEEELAAWKTKLLGALGTNGQVIVDVIPEVELILGEQPPIRELGASETRNRFNLAFKSFIRVFATEDHPLCLFLDDLQWADAASLNLIGVVLGDAEIRNLLLIGAYRDNEVDASHPLMIMLSELGGARDRVRTIALAPLGPEHVAELVADSLHASVEETRPLSDLATRKTHGNPFFLIQLLTSIHQRRLLELDASGTWRWDMAGLERLGITDNVVDLMVGKIQLLDAGTQRILQLAGCIGNQFDLATLARLHGASPRAAADALWRGFEAGLVVPLGDDYKAARASDDFDAHAIRARFLHDRVQQACYTLIPEGERRGIHRELGRLLRDGAPADALDERIYDIVAHVNLGAADVVDPAERYDAASLNLRAARRARASTAYGPALQCARAGVAFLPEGAWSERYDLALDLYTEVVDLEYLSLDFEEAETASRIVVEHARSVLDRIRVYETRIQYYVLQNRMQAAIDTVKEVLEMLEVPLTEELPADLDPEAISALPAMTDARYLAAMRILMSSMPAVYIAAPGLLPSVSFTMVRLTVRHGSSRIAAYAMSLYALIMAGVLGNYDVGFRFGELSLQLLERFQATELESKVYALVYIFVHHWKRHVRETLEPLLHGVKIGIDTGDVEYAGYNAVHYSTYYFFAGDELATAEARLAQYVDLSRDLKQEYGYNYIRVWRQLALALRRSDVRHDLLVGEAFDETTDAEQLGQMLPVHFSMHQARAMMRYFYGDHAGAAASAKQAEGLLMAVAGFVSGVQQNFYQSLSLLALAPTLDGEARAEALAKVDENIAKLTTWAEHQPANNQHKLDLVHAERARVAGEHLRAVPLYDRAIAGARKHGYLHEEALGFELASRFHAALGSDEVARHYRTAAYLAYERWGAGGKCAAMQAADPHLVFETVTSRRRPGTLTSSTHGVSTTSADGGSLDLVTVLKASQALAGEIHLGKLLETLMRIVIENVGAETGTLLLDRDGVLHLEAEAGAGRVHVGRRAAADAKATLPLTLVQYVARTKRPVALSSAEEDSLFGKDPYIANRRPRSVLCAPILHKQRLIGVFYFENNLAPGVFTDARLEVLTHLSGQVAISIENARLYEELGEHTRTLEQKVAERTLELEHKNHELRASLDRIQTMQQQIIIQEKLASLGTLTAGIAHELRNPLNFVNNFSSVTVDLVKELAESVSEVASHAGAKGAAAAEDARDLLGDIGSTATKCGRRTSSWPRWTTVATSRSTSAMRSSRRSACPHRRGATRRSPSPARGRCYARSRGSTRPVRRAGRRRSGWGSGYIGARRSSGISARSATRRSSSSATRSTRAAASSPPHEIWARRSW